MRTPGMLLTAPASGSGKTLITCGILQAFVNRGLKVVSFKCGPDYIDPMFHGKVIGTKSRNLDTFFTGSDTTRYLYEKNAAGFDLAVAEGVMGYYDGLGGIRTEGSTYDVARTLDLPAVLIVNCRGAGLSVLAMVKGFLEYRQDSRICGVILNQASPMIYEQLSVRLRQELKLRVFGHVPKLEELSLDSRHLGLVLPGEIEALREKLNRLAETLEQTLDLDGMLSFAGEYRDAAETSGDVVKNTAGTSDVAGGDAAKTAFGGSSGHGDQGSERVRKEIRKLSFSERVRIAVAEDDAFCFTYLDNLELLEEMGAELVPFSPMRDKGLPRDVSGLILSGGYPELHAEALGRNRSMREAVRKAVMGGMPCIAECGGFLYLHRELEGADGRYCPMAGVLDAKAYRTEKLSRFGYLTLEAGEDQLLGKAGPRVRGHEFHYWDSESCGESMHARKPVGKREWDCVHGTKNLYAGFPHLFYYSNLHVPHDFLAACLSYRRLQGGGNEDAAMEE